MIIKFGCKSGNTLYLSEALLSSWLHPPASAIIRQSHPPCCFFFFFLQFKQCTRTCYITQTTKMVKPSRRNPITGVPIDIRSHCMTLTTLSLVETSFRWTNTLNNPTNVQRQDLTYEPQKMWWFGNEVWFGSITSNSIHIEQHVVSVYRFPTCKIIH